MPWLIDRVSRLRWMAVPIAAYLAITLGLPLARGAAIRGGFAHHAAWVLAGCAAILVVALIGGIAIELVHVTIGRLRSPPGGPS
jgi:hypothetical protein